MTTRQYEKMIYNELAEHGVFDWLKGRAFEVYVPVVAANCYELRMKIRKCVASLSSKGENDEAREMGMLEDCLLSMEESMLWAWVNWGEAERRLKNAESGTEDA